MTRQSPLLAVLISRTSALWFGIIPGGDKKTYPVFASGLLDATLAFAANAVAGPSTTDSAEVPGTMAGREVWTVTKGHGQAEERGDQEYIFHFAGLRELVKVF